MPKTSTHVLSTSRKHTTGFVVKIAGGCCRCTVLKAACYWLSNHCIPVQKCVSMLEGVKSKPFIVGVRLRQGCVLSPFLFIVYNMNCVDNHSRVVEGATVGSCRINPFTFCGWFGAAFIFSKGSSACIQSTFCCVQPSRNENQH